MDSWKFPWLTQFFVKPVLVSNHQRMFINNYLLSLIDVSLTIYITRVENRAIL